MSDDLDLDALLELADRAAAAGSAVVIEASRRASVGAATAREKGPGDWVTDADTASERAVRAVLEEAAPDLPFFGEELGGERGDAGWYVDPLDGTANFVHGFPIVGVSVALVVSGEPVVGVVQAPFLGSVYAARRGGGAFANDAPIRVSDRPPASAICATGFPFRAKRELLPGYFPVFERALREFEDLRRAGAASLDLAWTGAGVFDGFFEERLATWDVAAGALIVREAGGIVTDWSGDDRAWLSSGNIVAASPAVHPHLLDLIAAARDERG
jgi:myo-inositol-1(or 4)-monophosphatase